MDLFGIAPLELIVVLLVAILVLGPSRMVVMARDIGKFWRQAQGALRELADEATIKLDEEEESDEPEPLPEPSDSVSRSSSITDRGASNGRRGRRARDGAEETRRRG